MKEAKDYSRDLAEIRSMMERSSKFLSLSGWAGILVGVYALAGAYVAYTFFQYNPEEIPSPAAQPRFGASNLSDVVSLAFAILVLALATVIFLSFKKANKRGEKFWNPTARRLLVNMAVPFMVGVILVLILLSKGLVGFIAPFCLVFYGLALYNASKFTYEEVKVLGLTQLGLGLFSAYFVEYGLICWALGFGVVHIVYGIYMHYKYER